MPAGTVADCLATGDCYRLTVGGARPAAHWDASARETLDSGETRDWVLHVGDSFADVPRTSPYYRFVETLLHTGVTSGCGASSYCPGNVTTRQEMAVFVLVSMEGAGYAPPACTTPVFADVPASSPFCRYIEEMFRRGTVGGCGGGNYCPTAGVTRDQMGVFLTVTFSLLLYGP